MISDDIFNKRLNCSHRIKLIETKKRIKEWYESWGGDIYVAFSGGKDSTVLLHIVRNMYPDVPAVFNNTGVEYPEILSFVREIENVIYLKPKLYFHEIIKKFGYPIISKAASSRIRALQNPHPNNEGYRNTILTGVKIDGTKGLKLAKKWQYLADAPFKISDRCCAILKKEPAHRFEKISGLKPMLGTMAIESQARTINYKKRGCNYYGKNSQISNPLSFWTDKDIWEYISDTNCKYSYIYDKGYTRTGCIYCLFGVHISYAETGVHKFDTLYKTHPKLYSYAMNKLGFKEIFKFTGLPIMGEEKCGLI